MFDFPKDNEWRLERRIIKKKVYYVFELWKNDPDYSLIDPIAYFRRSTPSAMAKAILALSKKLKTK